MENNIFKPPYFLYEKFVKKQKEGVPFVIFFFFLITFILARTWVYLSLLGLIPESITRNVRGVHIHHFAWGILLNSVIGYSVMVLPYHYVQAWKIKLAAFFGIGLALTFDEFGMWLMLDDEYFIRRSYDAIIIVSMILFNITYFANLWKRLCLLVLKDLKRSKQWLWTKF